MKMKYSD